MALTEKVKEELAATTISRQSARSAELATMLRFSAELGMSGDNMWYDVDAASPAIAQRIVDTLSEVYDISATSHPVGPNGANKTPSFSVRITSGGKELTRRLGLVTRSGHQVVGLPPQVISGSIADNEAAWRGAFLAGGTLTEPGRSSALEIVCPCQEAALALVGCARRLGISAKTKETRGADRVVVRDGDAIGALLTRMGAQVTRLEWDEKRKHREVRASANRLANFDDANLRRSARAAVTCLLYTSPSPRD